jgi:hypothetical protein
VPSPVDDLARRAALRQTSSVESLARRSGDALGDLFRSLEALDDVALDRWLRAAVPVAQASESAAASAGIGYVRSLAQLYGHAVGDVAPVADLIGPALRGGTSYVDVWTRPVVTARAAISRGRTFAEAIEEGAAKASSLARTDVGLASRSGSTAAMQATPEVVGYRRVPDSSPCSFCLTIATRRYKLEALAPAHANCTCGVVPIFDDADPGEAIAHDAQRALDESDQDAERVTTEPSEIGPSTP